MKLQGKLKKMKMPEKKGMEMEGMEELAGEEMSDEAPAEEYGAEMPEELPSAPQDLEALSDDELLAEIKKRGLMSQLAGEQEQESEDEMPMA